jgi:hypothetical protein
MRERAGIRPANPAALELMKAAFAAMAQ